MQKQQLKLEIAALLISNPGMDAKELKRELFKTFKHEYDEVEVKEVLDQLEILNDQVMLSKEEDNIVVYPDQY